MEANDQTPLLNGRDVHERDLAKCNAPSTNAGWRSRSLTRSNRALNTSTRHRRLVVSFGSRATFKCKSMTTNLILTVLAVVAGVADMVFLPILTGSFEKHISCGRPRPISDTFFVQIYSAMWLAIIQSLFVLFACLLFKKFPWKSPLSHKMRFLVSLFGSVNFFLVTYASLPSRTPPNLQPLFYMVVIPLTITVRRILLGKSVSTPRLICAFAVMVGAFIALEPKVFKIDQGDDGTSSKAVGSGKAEWMVTFVLAFIPLALFNVTLEYIFENDVAEGKEPIHPLVLAMWISIWTFIFMVIFSFTDLIPNFGQAHSFHEFATDIEEGFVCMGGSAPAPGNCTLIAATVPSDRINPDPNCSIPISRFWMFIGIFLADNLMVLLLIKYSDGAIYSALVSALKAPLATIFWRLFELNKTHSSLIWHPVFDERTAFVLAGLLIIIPAAGVYNYLSYREEQEAFPHSTETEG